MATINSEPSPTPEMVECQDPKPILLAVSIYLPLPWAENIMPLQIARIGQLYIIGVPAEMTTMSGRRLKNTVYAALKKAGAPDDALVVITGLANSYSHYVTTWEEYQVQRYEGGSTLYGPHTLAAYQQIFDYLATALQTGRPVPFGPMPPDLTNDTFTFIPPVPVDQVPQGKTFGSIIRDVQAHYSQGQQAMVAFFGGDPRNNFMTQSSFLTVEQSISNKWSIIANDGDWSTKLHFNRTQSYIEIMITWDIPSDQRTGTYRIGHAGYYKLPDGSTVQYSGYSSQFDIRSF